MGSIKSKGSKRTPKYGEVTIDNSLPDLSQHPVVLKKVSEARAFLEKHPIPEHILNRHRSDK